MEFHQTQAVLDIGLTQLKLVVGTMTNQKLHVCGAFSTPTKGIVQGEIKSPKDFANSVKTLLDRARQSQLVVDELVVLLPNVGLTLTRQKTMRPTEIASRKVTPELLKKIRAEINRSAIKQFESYRLTVIDYIPIGYTLDAGTTHSEPPIGSYTNNVLVDAYVILISEVFAAQVNDIVANLGITILDMKISAFQAVYANIRKELLKESVMVADIGGQTTTLYTLTNGLLETVQVVPIGSSAWTSELADLWKISTEQAEHYKCLAGSAYANDKADTVIEPQLSNQNINEIAMASLIEDRMNDLGAYLVKMMKLLPSNKVFPILVTGGSANLDGIETKIEQLTKADVYSAIPIEIGVRHGQYGACVGALKKIFAAMN